MKKIILSIIVIATVLILSFSLVACSSATTQGQLAVVWLDFEEYTYKVTDNSGTEDVVGKYTVTIKQFDKGSTITDFGGAILSNVQKGYLVLAELEIGDVKYNTGNYFNIMNRSSYMLPHATYRIEKTNDVETFKMNGVYSGATLDYTMTGYGNSLDGSLPAANSPYYDNNEFHQTLRSISTFSTNLSFGFNVPIARIVKDKDDGTVRNEVGVAPLTALCASSEKVKTPLTETYKVGDTTPYKADGIDCFKVQLSRTTEVDGAFQTLYYSTSTVDNRGWDLTRVLVKIVEPTDNGTITYELEEINTIPA